MQWVEKVIKFLRFIFKSNQFKKKYRTKRANNLIKIIKSDKWQIIDIRNSIEFKNNHLDKAINIQYFEFKKKYWKIIDKKKKILIINSNYRSNLDVYQLLKKHSLKVYVLMNNYSDIANNPSFENFTSVYKII